MKILITSEHYPPEVGAASNRIYSFSEHLRAYNWDVLTLVTRAHTHVIDTDLHACPDTVYLTSPELPSRGLLLDPLYMLFLLIKMFLPSNYKKIRYFDPDIIFTSIPSAESLMVAWIYSKIFRCPLIVDIRTPLDYWVAMNSYYYRRRIPLLSKILYALNVFSLKIYRLLYQNACLVTSLTMSLCRILDKQGTRKVALLPNGADLSAVDFSEVELTKLRHKIGLSQSDKIIVFVGFFYPYYRLDVVIKALRLILDQHREHIVLLVVGEGSMKESLMRLASRLLPERSVVFTGAVSGVEVYRYISLSQIGVVVLPTDFTYFRYAIPIKVYEYLACGKPIIAVAPEGEMTELIRKNHVGIVIEPENSKKLGEAIHCLLSNSDLMLKYKRNAKAVAKKFDRSDSAKLLYHYISEIRCQDNTTEET